jgi:error-prone DNA polymerase
MERLRSRFFAGMAEHGIGDPVGTQIWDKLAAGANSGVPESHSISFAYLVYASSWLKLHYPAAFCAALLRAQPMGFYSPHSLIQDARRHGVPTLRPCVSGSEAKVDLEPLPDDADLLPIVVEGAEDIRAERWDHGWAVRLGIDSVRHVGSELAERIAGGRPYASIEDVARRNALDRDALEALATAGAFECFEEQPVVTGGRGGSGHRRRALWQAGAIAQGGTGKLAGIVTGLEVPELPGMSEQEEALADLWATGVATDGHPTRFLRPMLAGRGVVPARDLSTIENGAKVLVGGVVTHRQRPATASGVTFMNLEDETGLINVVVSVGCWARHGRVARSSPALLVRGRIERQETVVNVVAEKLEPLPIGAAPASRDFR